MTTQISLLAEVPEDLSGNRLDQIAARLFPDYSRAKLQGWIRTGALLVNDKRFKPKDRVKAGDILRGEAELVAIDAWSAEEIPLDIGFEDEHLLVVNKPANLAVHPAAGNRTGTVLNGLLHRCPR